ncbi:hypothetical protein ACJMK2_016730 [Sinanodonta woodiana]|uniref:BZIP domain-containing protein n=1 Tax=Sinanodonta woodiana TaxID=1069815 RepID=A0ABD3UUM6_SINWO
MESYKNGQTGPNKNHAMDHTFLQSLDPSFSNGVDMAWVMTDAYAGNQRRAKRPIPDNQKDEMYWEKRKKNNVAAKKSRENKRKLDLVIRDRLTVLEEENALLRRENCALKVRLGIPANVNFLTDEERENCLTTVRISMQNTYAAVDDVHIKNEIVCDQSPEHSTTDSSNGYNDKSPHGKANFEVGQGVTRYTPFGGVVLSITPPHEQSLDKYPSEYRGYCDPMPNAISSCTELPATYQSKQVMQYSPCSTVSSDGDSSHQEPFDLSIHGKNRYDSDGRSISQSPESNRDNISPDVTSEEIIRIKNDDDEIRNKLQQLSEQVSRMQQLIFTKQEHPKNDGPMRKGITIKANDVSMWTPVT